MWRKALENSTHSSFSVRRDSLKQFTVFEQKQKFSITENLSHLLRLTKYIRSKTGLFSYLDAKLFNSFCEGILFPRWLTTEANMHFGWIEIDTCFEDRVVQADNTLVTELASTCPSNNWQICDSPSTNARESDVLFLNFDYCLLQDDSCLKLFSPSRRGTKILFHPVRSSETPLFFKNRLFKVHCGYKMCDIQSPYGMQIPQHAGDAAAKSDLLTISTSASRDIYCLLPSLSFAILNIPETAGMKKIVRELYLLYGEIQEKMFWLEIGLTLPLKRTVTCNWRCSESYSLCEIRKVTNRVQTDAEYNNTTWTQPIREAHTKVSHLMAHVFCEHRIETFKITKTFEKAHAAIMFTWQSVN